jgi:four helix bundle protein
LQQVAREMAGWSRYEDIGAWQRASELCTMVRNICKRSSFARDLKLRDQMLDAARSGPRNIAEGFARWSHADFARFVRIAKSSEVELLNHFHEAMESGHITAEERQQLEHTTRKALKAAVGLIRWLERH